MRGKGAKRILLDDEFRKNLFDIAAKNGNAKELGKQLGYKGRYPGRRFNALRNLETQSFSVYQLKKLSEITSIPFDEIRKHIKTTT